MKHCNDLNYEFHNQSTIHWTVNNVLHLVWVLLKIFFFKFIENTIQHILDPCRLNQMMIIHHFEFFQISHFKWFQVNHLHFWKRKPWYEFWLEIHLKCFLICSIYRTECCIFSNIYFWLILVELVCARGYMKEHLSFQDCFIVDFIH